MSSQRSHNHKKNQKLALLQLPEVITDPVETAKTAGLRYVTDHTPGLSRKTVGKKSIYYDNGGKRIRDAKILDRIKALVIPPAWQKVWICSQENGHIQVTGLDERGRKQYRYHERWREVRDENKYVHMMAFGKALSKIRKATQKDLAQSQLSREKVLAAIVQLLEKTLIRVGNEEYAKTNQSYGLTTMCNRHVKVTGSRVKFKFRGKSGVYHEIDLQDNKLARVIQRLQDLPGQEIFQYLDEKNQVQSINSSDVNDYLKKITREDFTAKDFRTWAGTILVSLALKEIGQFETQAEAKKNIVKAIDQVAKRLGNTRSICRKCYIHPAVIESYQDGSMLNTLQQKTEQTLTTSLKGLEKEEVIVMTLLQQRLKKMAKKIKKF